MLIGYTKMHRIMEYVGHEAKTIQVDIYVHDEYKITDSSINKALMIAMNYLMENMETEEEESAE